MEDNKHKFKCTIERCVYNTPAFKIYASNVDSNKYPKIKKNSYDNVTIKGELPDLAIGAEYDIEAKEISDKYGFSYKVTFIKRDEPKSEEDVYNFLCEVLTQNQADALMNSYPDIIDRVKDDRLDDIDLGKIHGVGEKSFEKIKDKIIENFKLMDLVAEFKGVLSLNMIRKIYNKYTSIELLRNHLYTEPYATLTMISGIGFKIADGIVKELQNKGIVDFGCDITTSVDRCLACITYLLQENENDGHTKANIVDIRKECMKLAPSCTEHFAEAIQSPTIYYNKETLDIALTRTRNVETYIAESIASNIDNDDNIWGIDTEKYRRVGEFDLSDEQMAVLDNMCKHNINILRGVAGCVDCDTEFFTGTGWKRIADYEEGDKVLQYNEDGTAELVEPLAYIKQPSDYLWHFETKYGLNQCLSGNHECYYITSKGNLYHKQFSEIMKNQNERGFRGLFITSFDYSGKGIDLTDDEIRLMIATFADGSFYSTNKHLPESDKYKQARFHIKKDRKKKRLEILANACGAKWHIAESAADGYDDYYIDVPFRAKHYPKEWYNCNKHQLEVIADEVMFWDGDYKKNNRYSTSCKDDADFIQFVYSSIGYRATISINDRTGEEYLTCGKLYKRKSIEYSVSYTTRNHIGMCTDSRSDHTKTKINQYKTKDGYEYCFTVPSHILVLRRGNKIFITGNCGKSFSTQAVINMLDDNDKSYILMSPTGKAAKVLAEYTKRKVSTIHRGLGYKPEKNEWWYNKERKMGYDVVIIDEFSMVDVMLFRRVIDAIDFEHTKLLMIGDSAQLPSVGCGNILQDMVASGVVPVATLNTVFRYNDGGLAKVATDARCSKAFLNKGMRNKTTAFGKDGDYVFMDLDPEKMVKKAVDAYKKLSCLNGGTESVQVLTSQNKGDYGTIVLNNEIQKEVNANYGSNTFMKIGNTVYFKGDIVMQTKNNYKAEIDKCCWSDEDKELYEKGGEKPTAFVANGESGVIKNIVNGYVVIDYDGIVVRYYREEMERVSLGYAITCHKSQGSSIDNVILCTPRSHIFMLDSNLLYVGLTRTKKRCLHIGSLDTVNQAIKKKANMSRNTFMKDMLIAFYR